MKIYHYYYQHPHANATILIQARTADGEEAADDIAREELAIALGARQIDWYATDIEEEDEF